MKYYIIILSCLLFTPFLYGQTPMADSTKDSHPIHHAVKNNNITQIKQAIKKGFSINDTTHSGKTPLHISCQSNNIDVVKFLLDNGADPYILDRGGWSALSLSIYHGNYDIALFLINNRIDIEKSEIKWDRILPSMMSSISEKELDQLIELEKTIVIQDRDGNTPLHYAAMINNQKALRYLISKGADPYRFNNNQESAYYLLLLKHYKNNFREFIASYSIDTSRDEKIQTYVHKKNQNYIIFYFILFLPLLYLGYNIYLREVRFKDMQNRNAIGTMNAILFFIFIFLLLTILAIDASHGLIISSIQKKMLASDRSPQMGDGLFWGFIAYISITVSSLLLLIIGSLIALVAGIPSGYFLRGYFKRYRVLYYLFPIILIVISVTIFMISLKYPGFNNLLNPDLHE